MSQIKYTTGLHALFMKIPRFITPVMVACLKGEFDTSNAVTIAKIMNPKNENPVATMRLIVTL